MGAVRGRGSHARGSGWGDGWDKHRNPPAVRTSLNAAAVGPNEIGRGEGTLAANARACTGHEGTSLAKTDTG
jgi:hypothetical protein